MAFSLGFSAYAHHAKSLDEIGRTSMHRAVGVHQIAALGLIIPIGISNGSGGIGEIVDSKNAVTNSIRIAQSVSANSLIQFDNS